MDRDSEMRLFVSVVERGGLTAAAEELDMTPSAVSRGLARLEERLGVRLLERTTRRIALTPEGESYFEASRRILAEIAEAEAVVVASRGRPRGLLRINSGVAFAIHQLAAALPEFRERYQDIQVDLSVTDRLIDPIAENVDVTIRTGVAVDDRLVARPFAEFHRVICASPAYLARHGRPQQPRDLLAHECIYVSASRRLSQWPFTDETLEMRGTLSVDNAEAVLALALAGAGVARLGDIVVAEAIRDGRLEPLLVEQHIAEPLPLLAVFPPGRQRLPKIRVFLDFLFEKFSAMPWRLDMPAG